MKKTVVNLCLGGLIILGTITSCRNESNENKVAIEPIETAIASQKVSVNYTDYTSLKNTYLNVNPNVTTEFHNKNFIKSYTASQDKNNVLLDSYMSEENGYVKLNIVTIDKMVSNGPVSSTLQIRFKKNNTGVYKINANNPQELIVSSNNALLYSNGVNGYMAYNIELANNFNQIKNLNIDLKVINNKADGTIKLDVPLPLNPYMFEDQVRSIYGVLSSSNVFDNSRSYDITMTNLKSRN